MNAIMEADFDGIYMDWVEAFTDPNVEDAAATAGVAPDEEMFKLVEEIRTYAHVTKNEPDFLVVAQNAPDLFGVNPTRYINAVDAIAMEAIWYDGKTSSFEDWTHPEGYNIITNEMGPDYEGWTEKVLSDLKKAAEYMLIFAAEYAQFDSAAEVYEQLAKKYGFSAYCTRRSLAQLSTTPYPLGYDPVDYS